MQNAYFYVLLDYIFDLGASASALADPKADCNFNRPHHGLEKMPLFDALIEMQASGIIEFRDRSELLITKTISVTDLKNHESKIFVFLTDVGGYEWEKAFDPDWSKYILDCYMLGKNDCVKASIETGSVDTADYVEEGISRVIHPVNIKKSILSPWKPTYWEILNEGHLIEFNMLTDTPGLLSQLKRDLPWRKPLKPA